MKSTWLKMVLIGTISALTVRGFVIENFRVESASMSPTLLPGDLVFANKLTFRFRSPHLGEIVVFSLPQGEPTVFAKRIVGLPGDEISIRDGKLMRNGVAADYLATPVNSADFGPVSVPAEHFFVMGDNRNDSIDGRVWGPIPYRYLKGKLSVSLSPCLCKFPTVLL